MSEHKTIPATPNRIRLLVQNAKLDGRAYVFAMKAAGFYPDRKEWLRFASTALLYLGAAMLLVGIIFFFASNWAHMHKFTKFLVIDLSIIITLIIAWRCGMDDLTGKISIATASVLIGVLLAVFGQVYQTGADPYQLFLAWALLIFPWTVMARLLALWFIWLVILQTGLALYWSQGLGIAPHFDPAFGFTIAVINILFLCAWELAYLKKVAWVGGSWFPHILNITTVAILSVVIIHYFLDRPMPLSLFKLDGMLIALFISYVLILAGGGSYFSRTRIDLFHLTVFISSLIGVVSVLCFRVLSQYVHQPKLFILLLGLIILSQISLATGWLMRTAKRVDV